MTRGPFARSDTVRRRLALCQLFSAHELENLPGSYAIGIGPPGDFMQLATTGHPRTANMLVDALRSAAEQPPCPSPLPEISGAQVAAGESPEGSLA